MKIDFEKLTDIDWVLFFSSILLIVIGILFIYSSGVTASGEVVSQEYLRQIVWGVSGLFFMLAFSFLDYTRYKDLTIIIYIGTILVLLITLVFGKVVNGSRSWLGFGSIGIQPSEFAKVSTILFFAAYLDNIGPHIQKLHRLLIGLVIVMIPMGLIILQPDMGTALVFVPLFLIMAFMAGAQLKHIFFFIASGTIMILVTVIPIWENYTHQAHSALSLIIMDWELVRLLLAALILSTIVAIVALRLTKKKYFYIIAYLLLVLITGLMMGEVTRAVLKEYQIMRLIVFLDPQVDPQGAGWNIIQSVTAVGSGGLSGKGFLRGTQSQYQFLPEQSTDFIFSIIAEEWGFLGGLMIFTLFIFIFIRFLFIISFSRDKFGVFVGSGLLTMFFVHIIINVGMTMGIMPIMGIPLFFLSYGGSSLWTGMISMGIMISIYHRRYRN